MPEPISTFVAVSSLVPLLKKGFNKILESDLANAPFEDVSSNLAHTAFNKLISKLPKILESPENHNLLKAVRRSYLNATLVMCYARLQNINPSKFDVKNLIRQVVPNSEEPNKVVKILKGKLHSSDEEANKEIEWLFRATEHLNAEIENISDWDVTKTFEEVTKNVDLLLKPENVDAQINDIKEKLKMELFAELASTAYFQHYETKESIGKDSYDKCLPPKILESINKGWFLLEDDGSILKQSAEKVDFKWFDVMSVFFAEEIKTDTNVNNIFNAKMLVDLKYQNGQPCNFSANDFAENLAKANKIILNNLESIKKNVEEINSTVKLLLPLVTDIQEVRVTLQLIVVEQKKTNQGIEELQKGQEESKRIDEEILRAICKISPIRNLPKTIYFPETPIGRKDILDELQKTYDSGKRKFVLYGLGGVGKSRVCLEFAKRNQKSYFAQILVDMQGLSENPLSAHDAMLQVIRQFDLSSQIDSTDESQIVIAYRNFVQQQPTMIVLDNAENLESVELLYQTNDVFILTTSRNVFDETDEINLVKINQMSENDSVELLYSIAGKERFEGKAEELARLTGYLPITLKVLASILHADDLGLETATGLIAKYQDAQKLLEEKVPDYKHLPYRDKENLKIAASFELSYKKLSDDLKLYWRWLSISPSDFDLETLRHILGIKIEEANRIQKELRNHSLLEYNVETKRFKFHDLVREFANSKLDENSLESLEKEFFFKRWVISFQLWLFPEYIPLECLEASYRHADHYAGVFADAYEMKNTDPENGFMDALNLIDKEWSNIIAGQRWAADHAEMDPKYAETCCRYSSISEFLGLRLTPQETIAWQEDSLKAAKLLGNEKREAMYLNNMGIAQRELGNYEKAIKLHIQSLEIARQLKDEEGESSALGNLAIIYVSSGESKKAIEILEPILQTARQNKNRKRESLTLGTLGSVYNSLGNFSKAIELHTQSLKMAQEIGDLEGESVALTNLANTYSDLGDSEKAQEYDRQALEISQKIGDKLGENLILHNMSSPRNFSTGEEFESSAKKFEELLETARQNDYPLEEFRCLYGLGTIYLELDIHPKAVEYLDLALTKARQIGDKEKEMHCLGHLGNIFGMVGDDHLAIEICDEALELAREIGDRLSEGVNLQMLGLGYACLGEMQKAYTYWKEALAIFEAIESPNAEKVRSLIIEAKC